ncbi:putative transcription regulator containing HTH domain [Caulobacter sp. AP07]|nr:putative transcription regulator containing HTH domain [Caulobacter sp. AP07]
MVQNISIIHDEAGYASALAEYESYFDHEPDAGGDGANRFELLGLLLAKYEEDHFPMPAASPVEAIRFAMERQGLNQSDLATLLASRSRASEILNGRRELTLPQIRLLSKAWRIPAQALIGEQEVA